MCSITKEYDGLGCFGHFNCCFGACDCTIGYDYVGFTHADDLFFFRRLRLEHYQELRQNVFVWLDALHFQYLQNDNPKYILESIYAEMKKDSMFYNDARRHMSRQMRKNIDNFEKSLKDYNDYINSNNEIIGNRINEIISIQVYSKLTNDQSSSIYSIVQVAFSQAIKGTDDVETALKKWNMATKLRSHGFNNQAETDAKSILAAIEQDQNIMDRIKELKSKTNNLVKQQNIIKGQSREISNQIQHKVYRSVRRCCPNLIKELWHTLW